MIPKTFFGQLEHIFVLQVEAQHLGLKASETVAFAVIRQIEVEAVDQRLDIHYYTKTGPLDVVDLNTVKCIVGRVPSAHLRQTGVIDRSGNLARAVWDAEV
jgi:hypothetical protein